MCVRCAALCMGGQETHTAFPPTHPLLPHSVRCCAAAGLPSALRKLRMYAPFLSFLRSFLLFFLLVGGLLRVIEEEQVAC